MKKTIKIVLIIVALLVMIVYLFCSLFILGGITGDFVKWRPFEGTWYCDELKMQLSFGETGECFTIVDGQKIRCTWENDRNSQWISVAVLENSVSDIPLYSCILEAEFVELTETEYIVCEQYTKNVYTFKRIE